MALFQYNNILLPYQIHFAPFDFDLLLLQGSKFNSDFWLPVIGPWKGEATAGGRVITCDWNSEGMTGGDLAEYFHRFFLTLGLHSLRAIACDDAAKIIRNLEADFPGSVDHSLLYPKDPPRGVALVRAVDDFLKK